MHLGASAFTSAPDYFTLINGEASALRTVSCTANVTPSVQQSARSEYILSGRGLPAASRLALSPPPFWPRMVTIIM